jgi:hypothetical protein
MGEPASAVRRVVSPAGRLWSVVETARRPLPLCAWDPGEAEGAEAGVLLPGSVGEDVDVRQGDVVEFRGRLWLVGRVGDYRDPWDGSRLLEVGVSRPVLADVALVRWFEGDGGEDDLGTRSPSVWVDGPAVAARVVREADQPVAVGATAALAGRRRVAVEVADGGPRLRPGDKVYVRDVDLLVEADAGEDGLAQTVLARETRPAPQAVLS